MDSGLEIDQIYVGIRISIVEILCVPFSAKMDNFDFFGPNLPKNGLGLEIQKTNVGIRISILEISCVPSFRKNRQLWLFRSKFAQKWILGSEFGISTSKIPYAPIFSLKLTKLSNYVQYFGANNVEDIAKSWWRLKWAGWRWMELGGVWNGLGGGGWNWVEVGARFRNIRTWIYTFSITLKNKIEGSLHNI